MMNEEERIPLASLLLRQADIADHLALGRFQGAGHRRAGPGEVPRPAAVVFHDRGDRARGEVDLKVENAHRRLLAADDLAGVDRNDVGLLPGPYPIRRDLVMAG